LEAEATTRTTVWLEGLETPWLQPPNKLYRPAKLVPTFAVRGCHVVNATDPYGRILDFLDRARITSTEKCNGFIGNRSRDIPSCSIVPQPTTLLLTTIVIIIIIIAIIMKVTEVYYIYSA
jgi:hypothetical protein